MKRISGLHLALPPLGNHGLFLGGYSAVDEDDQDNLFSDANSQWTTSAAPRSSASLYSQASYANSPIPFSEKRIDRRRFGLALSADWQPIRNNPRNPGHETFVLDLHSATLQQEEDDYLANKSTETLMKKESTEEILSIPNQAGKGSVMHEQIFEKEDVPKETKYDVVKGIREADGTKLGKLITTSKALGRMFSMLSAHPSRENFPEMIDERVPLLPAAAPQIDVAVPSPGLRITQELRESEVTPTNLIRSLQAANIPGNRRTLPSAWKPCRPPSPIPKALKKQRKNTRKQNATSVAFPVTLSPVPPLPRRPLDLQASSTLNALKDTNVIETAVTPPKSALDEPRRSDNLSWEELEGRLKARAMKSEPYVIQEEAALSPFSP